MNIIEFEEWAEAAVKEILSGGTQPPHIRQAVPRRILDQHEYLHLYDLENVNGELRYKVSMQPTQLDYELDAEYLKRQKWESEIY